ncbi:MAG: DinB family protein [Actinomycetota bacterium]
MRTIPRPRPGEFAPYTVEYFRHVPDNVLDYMSACLDSTPSFFAAIPRSRLDRPHQPGEWTVKDILLHICDDERIYAYRALRFARNDLTALPSFEQDVVATHSQANSRSLDSLLDEYRSVRRSTLSLFDGLPDDALARVGTANGNPMSVRAAAFHIAGHEAHHLDSISTNYLDSAGSSA